MQKIHVLQYGVISATCKTDDDKAEISPTWRERNKCCTV